MLYVFVSIACFDSHCWVSDVVAVKLFFITIIACTVIPSKAPTQPCVFMYNNSNLLA